MTKYKKFTVSLIAMFFLTVINIQAQQTTITGTVVDAESGDVLPGVNVVVKGTTTGTSTDEDGIYQLTVPADADTLTFSFIGFEKHNEPINNRTTINVSLQPSVQAFGDVVVTAFGVEQNERSLGYSVQQVDSEELEKATEANLVTALSGKVSGVRITNTGGAPGQSSSIIIRGINSLDPGANNQPLFVVDGIPIDNSTDVGAEGFDSRGFSNRAVDINPSDIASLNVLKGSAATALYGVRAANGAVIITTKQGKAGEVQVNYNGTVGADQVNRFPDVQQTYTQGFSGVYDPESFWCCWGAPLEEARQQDPDAKVYNNWKRAYETGFKVSNDLSITGGSETARFYASFGNLKQTGVLPFSDWDRTSIRLNADVDLSDKIVFGTDLNYVNSGGDRVFADRFNERIVYWTVSQDVSDYLKDNGTMKGYYGTDDNVGTNPIYDARYATYNDDVNRIIGNVNISYDPLDWLNISYRMGMDYYADFREQKTQGPQGIPGENALSSTFSMGETRIKSRDLTSTLSLNISRQLTEKLNMDLTLGNDVFDRDYERVFAFGSDFLTPNFYQFSNATNLVNSQHLERRRLIGVYGALNLNYDYTYYLNITGRNDWSSTLPEDNRSFFYPSVNAGYVFTETFETPDFLTYGKLRASWAQVGKDAPPHVIGTFYVRPGAFPINGQGAYSRSSEFGATDLKPELTTTIELGVDLRFLEDRFSLDATWYKSSSKDQIIPVPISNTVGYSTYYTNAGEIENRGFELIMDADLVETQDFDWSLTLNFSRNRNEVISIREGIERIALTSQFGYAGSTAYLQLIEGAPYGAIFGTSYARYYGPGEQEDPLYVDKDRPILIGSDGFPVIENELKIVGNMTPNWIGGIMNSFRYKNFELSALVDISYGAEKYNQYNNFFAAFGIAKYTLNRNETKVFEGVTADGQPNTQEVWLGQGTGPDGRDYGAGFYRNTYRASTENSVMDASYIKLRNLSVTYNLPISIVDRLQIRNASVRLSANNLILWTPYKFWDPEITSSGAGSNAIGLSGLAHPGVASYAVTVSLGF